VTTPQQPQPKKKVRFKVEPEPGGQLEQYLIQNKLAKDEADVAGEAADQYKASVKAWLLSLFPNQADLPDAFDIPPDPHGRYPGYSMTLKGGFRIDTDAVRDAGMYERFAKPVTPSWDLREAGGRRR
jgi:hypothetical protein